MFGELQSIANLAKYPSSANLDVAPRVIPRTVAAKRLERFGLLYGACQPMRDLFHSLDRLSRSTAPVMILGESGSGKELVATTLHHLSGRKDKPFIAVNCGAIPENLIESELFGHERGSFTGAARTHRGCFERADGGTLFLDEVTEMPVEMQVRLLRVLETGRFTRVGGDQEIGSDVRVLAASNRDLRQAVASGKLREDLMYRLCVIPVNVPALRDRGDDAVLLAEMFLAELNEEHGEQKMLSVEGRRRIAEHTWPGNVRELKNVVHRAFVLSDEEVQVDINTFAALGQGRNEEGAAAVSGSAVPAASTLSDPSALRISVGMSLEDVERTLITATLQAVGGSKTEAARMLGISLKTMYNRLHAYGDGCIRRKPMPSSNGYDAWAA